MLVLMLEVQNSVMVLLILAFRIISVVFTFPNNLQIIGVRLTEDALYMCVYVHVCMYACLCVYKHSIIHKYNVHSVCVYDLQKVTNTCNKSKIL